MLGEKRIFPIFSRYLAMTVHQNPPQIIIIPFSHIFSPNERTLNTSAINSEKAFHDTQLGAEHTPEASL
jgi:hypothetical protein